MYIYVNVNHILILHNYVYTFCNWEIMFSTLFIYYPRRKTHNNEVITTTDILLLVTTVALVCV